jgi:phosphoserine phosphatase
LTPERVDRVLAVDLDGTLVTTNTFPHFVRFLLGHLSRRRRWSDGGRVVAALLARKVLRRPHQHLKGVVCDVAANVDRVKVRSWADRLLDRHLNPEVAELVRTWDATKVLATSAPEPYASVIGDALGFDAVHGSRLVAGELVENVGHEKAMRLRKLVPGLVDTAVTDDEYLDGPMLAMAQRRLVVIQGRLQTRPGARIRAPS